MRVERPQWYQVPEYWPAIAPGVAEALRHGRDIYTPADILRELLCREMFLWLVMDGENLRGFAVTQVMNYPHTRAYHVLLLAGEAFAEWGHLHPELVREATALKCQVIEFCGRAGWKKVAAPFGYEPITTLYRKVLE